MRCYVAEFIGTFAIVLLGCGSIALMADSPAKHLSVNIVFGVTVAAMIYTLGHISKAHFNPAVTLGFLAAKRFPLSCAIGYWIAQFSGAILAAALISTGLGAHTVGATTPSVSVGAAFALEAVLTFFLMLVIAGTATDRRAAQGFAGAAIGGTVLMNGLFAGQLTGNSLNPARSLGPALFQPGALDSIWIYFAAPALGAVCASLLYAWMAAGDQTEPIKGTCC